MQNKIIFEGVLISEPRSQLSKANKTFWTLELKQETTFRNKSYEQFVEIMVFNENAMDPSRQLKIGDHVIVEGRLSGKRMDWPKGSGKNRIFMSLSADAIRFMDEPKLNQATPSKPNFGKIVPKQETIADRIHARSFDDEPIDCPF